MQSTFKSLAMRLFLGLPILACAAPTVRADDAGGQWAQFRGPGALGSAADDPSLPETWSTTENVAWKTGIPGLGWASPVAWGERVFILSVESDGEQVEPKKGLYFGGEQKQQPDMIHRWMVHALDLKTGERAWQREVSAGVPFGTHHIKNTYASETPVTDGERVYAYFGNRGLFVLDMEGNAVWSKTWEPVRTRFGWGTAASPVLHEGRIYIVNDNDTKSYLTALDAKTGKEIWNIERDEKSNWATPYVWVNEQRSELITPGTGAVRSYDLEGRPLWDFKGMSTIAIPTPFSKFGLLYVSSGYVGDKLRPVYAIKPGASGDISLKPGEKSNSHIAWHLEDAGPYNPSPLVYGDIFYVLYDRGFFAAFDARTGKAIYPDEKKRIDKNISGFTASPWAYNGKVFCLSEDGDTYVIQAGKDYAVLGKNALGEMCMATPAIHKGNLIVRTQSQVYCIRKGS